jgi:hypothetical protein
MLEKNNQEEFGLFYNYKIEIGNSVIEIKCNIKYFFEVPPPTLY